VRASSSSVSDVMVVCNMTFFGRFSACPTHGPKAMRLRAWRRSRSSHHRHRRLAVMMCSSHGGSSQNRSKKPVNNFSWESDCIDRTATRLSRDLFQNKRGDTSTACIDASAARGASRQPGQAPISPRRKADLTQRRFAGPRSRSSMTPWVRMKPCPGLQRRRRWRTRRVRAQQIAPRLGTDAGVARTLPDPLVRSR
jgi:hypothetical protein